MIEVRFSESPEPSLLPLRALYGRQPTGGVSQKTWAIPKRKANSVRKLGDSRTKSAHLTKTRLGCHPSASQPSTKAIVAPGNASIRQSTSALATVQVVARSSTSVNWRNENRAYDSCEILGRIFTKAGVDCSEPGYPLPSQCRHGSWSARWRNTLSASPCGCRYTKLPPQLEPEPAAQL